MKVVMAIDDGGNKALREGKKERHTLFFGFSSSVFLGTRKMKETDGGPSHVRLACLISERERGNGLDR